MIINKQEKLIREIAKNFSLDYRVCKEIINSPFLYLKYIVTDSAIEEGIRIPYFGAFCQKGNYKNKTMRTKNRVDILLDNIVDVTVMMSTTLGFELPSVESGKKVVEKAFEDGDYEKINMIWGGWLEYNK